MLLEKYNAGPKPVIMKCEDILILTWDELLDIEEQEAIMKQVFHSDYRFNECGAQYWKWAYVRPLTKKLLRKSVVDYAVNNKNLIASDYWNAT